MTRKLLKYTLGLPLLVLPRVLNYLLQDFADSFEYSRADMDRHPVVFSLLGWMFVYVLLCLLSPLMLFIGPLFAHSTPVASMIVFGLLMWLVALAYLLASLRWIVKKLTGWLMSFRKVNISLRSQKLTTDEALYL